jgi:putative ABC transport system permease protein
MLSFTLATVWHERQRFLAGILAVAFSAVLIMVQTGLLWGLFATTSAPIDQAAADVWVGAPRVPSLDLGRPISELYLARLAGQPDDSVSGQLIEPPEICIIDYNFWVKPDGSKELCIVIGTRLGPHSLGAVRQLTPQLRALLTEPGAVVMDEREMGRLSVKGINETAEVNGRRVRVVGFVRGLKSLTAPYLFCSLDTARTLVPILPGQATYLLARSRDAGSARRIAERMRSNDNVSAFTREEFSLRTRLYWLIMTNAGITAGFTTALGLLVGAVVTSQTLYAATIASLKEFSLLRAMGIPRWRIAIAMLALAGTVGLIGVIVSLPITFMLAPFAIALGTQVLLPWWLVICIALITWIMALLSGLAALRSLRLMDPALVLR